MRTCSPIFLVISYFFPGFYTRDSYHFSRSPVENSQVSRDTNTKWLVKDGFEFALPVSSASWQTWMEQTELSSHGMMMFTLR